MSAKSTFMKLFIALIIMPIGLGMSSGALQAFSYNHFADMRESGAARLDVLSFAYSSVIAMALIFGVIELYSLMKRM